MPGVYIRERDRGLRRKRFPIIISESHGGDNAPESYIYTTFFSNAFTEYPIESGSIGKVWISGSSYSHKNSFLFIKNDNTLWAVGDNTDGQLGLGNKTSTEEIQQVGTDTWQQVAVGVKASAGITIDSKLYTWGSNTDAQLGTGDLVEYLEPTWIAQDSTWKSVSVGHYQSIAVKSDGTLWSWGSASNGEMGLGSDASFANTPTQVGSDSDWASVYAFDRVSLGLKEDGSLYGWGHNRSYVIAQPDDDLKYNTPVLIDVGPWKKVTSDGFTVYAIKNDDTLWGWGSNDGGLLTSGSATDEGITGVYGPVGELTDGLFDPETNTSKRITTVLDTASISTISNSLLGSASLTLSSSPTSGDNDDGYWTVNLPFPIQYNGDTYSTVYVSTNSYLTFGAGSTNYNPNAGNPAVDKIFISAYDNYAYRIYYGQEGTTFRIRFEGNSEYNQGGGNKVWEAVFYQNTPNQIDIHIGDNGNWRLFYNTNQPTPLQLGTDTWKDISISVYGEVQYEAGGGVKTNGTLWMWGSNDLGQLGLGDTVDRQSPTQVGSDTSWVRALRGLTKNMALKG